MNPCSSTLFIEPFYGGSHKQLVDLLMKEFGGDLLTLPSTKWHWRMRVSALHFSLTIPHKTTYRTLFASSVLNLCELVSLRPDLGRLHKVLYFHENQLIYPVRKQKDRDFQYGYNQILSCLVADTVLFNSEFNMSSFLDSIDSFLNLIPDHKPRGLADIIRPKCSVLYFPILLSPLETSGNHPTLQTECCDVLTESEKASSSKRTLVLLPTDPQVSVSPCQSSSVTLDSTSEEAQTDDNTPVTPHASTHDIGADPSSLHILWPHRWEHDKGPEEFCVVLRKLLDAHLDFRVSILGSHTNDIPDCFKTLLPQLGPRLLHQGYQPLDDYRRILRQADVVVSTAHHEFFGVSMLEAACCGCYPLCPNCLVYPEIYPPECLYNTEQQLFKRLRRFCQHPEVARASSVRIRDQLNMEKYKWSRVKEGYRKHLMQD